MTDKTSVDTLMKRCVSPYSNIKVACVLKSTDYKIHNGVNVESASYGLTICAERNAIFSAISAGQDMTKIQSVHLYSNMNTLYPCGACAQIMTEYLPKNILVYCYSKHEVEMIKVKDLLPYNFSL